MIITHKNLAAALAKLPHTTRNMTVKRINGMWTVTLAATQAI